tara:strand:+ start:11188 stop:11430 length:243 start_codon:yes stop_codon:yes gene_type:complete
MTDTVEFTFKIPRNRQDCIVWLQTQTPEIVADIFSISQSVYNMMINGTTSDTDTALKIQKNTELYTKKNISPCPDVQAAA